MKIDYTKPFLFWTATAFISYGVSDNLQTQLLSIGIAISISLFLSMC